MVSTVHCPYLRYSHMTLINDRDEIFRETVHEAEGPRTRCTAVKVPGVILYSTAVAQLLDHLQVILNPLFNALSLLRPTGVTEVPGLQNHIILYHAYSGIYPFTRRHEEVGRIDHIFIKILPVAPADRVKC